MPTLDIAARQLGVSEKTLRKWMRLCDPPIEAKPHKRDGRYRVITPEDVERVRQILAERPGVAGIHKEMLYDALRSPSAGLGYTDASPTVTPAPRQRPLQRGSLSRLPDGMMDVTTAGRLHGVPRSTLAAWIRDKHVEVDSGTYGGEHGHWRAVRPLTRRGLAQFYALAHRRPGFTACPQCPHDSAGGAGET